MAGPTQATSSTPKKFFHYRDARGQDVVVDSFEDIPAEFRHQIREVKDGLPPPPPPSPVPAPVAAPVSAPQVIVVPPSQLDFSAPLHVPSMLLGILSSLLAVLVYQLICGMAPRAVARLVIFAALGAGVATGLVTLAQQQLTAATDAHHRAMEQQRQMLEMLQKVDP